MKVLIAFGTRPEVIKMAPVIKEFQKQNDVECVVVTTAQHRQLLDQMLHLFDIVPDYDLNIMKENQTPVTVMSSILTQMEEIFKKENPDLVFVHGDTQTTAATAQTAFYMGIPVAHVEAGLRTYDTKNPFPEEANRQGVRIWTELHFASTDSNRENLLNEHVKPEHIHVVGNSVIDVLIEYANKPLIYNETLQKIMASPKRKILMTTHRRENFGQLQNVYRAVNRILNEFPNVELVFPLHLNPSVQKQVAEHLTLNDQVHLIESQDYHSFTHLMKEAYLILTDSGGIQEEAPSLGKPVLVARTNTERPEGVLAGTLKLSGTSEEGVYQDLKMLLTNVDIYQEMSEAKNPFGDGTTSEKIVQITKQFLQSKKIGRNI